jgi:hypothetical protein
MAIASNTFLTYSAKGIREDLSNVIYNISPEETPFVSNVGKGSIANVVYDWQTDALANAAANAQLEGDETAYDAVTATVRLQNYAQISRKTVIISGTEEKVNKAGRRSEVAYQIAKRGAELKRDIEFVCVGTNQAAVAGNSTTARQTGSLQAFLKTNTSKDVTTGSGLTPGADPVYTTIPTAARTDSTTLRAFTEPLLKAVIQSVWKEGGTPKLLMVGPYNKTVVSSFAGIAETRIAATSKPTTIIAAADVYVSDFGNVSIVPNRFQRERDAFVLDPEYASIDYLRPMQTMDMAKTGDADKKLMLAEWGLRVMQEKAHGGIFDLTISA